MTICSIYRQIKLIYFNFKWNILRQKHDSVNKYNDSHTDNNNTETAENNTNSHEKENDEQIFKESLKYESPKNSSFGCSSPIDFQDLLQFEIVDLNNEPQQCLPRRYYSIDSQQWHHRNRKLNTSLTLSFSRPHSSLSSKDIAYDELVKSGAPSFENYLSHSIHDRSRSSNNSPIEFLNGNQFSHISINGSIYSNPTVQDFRKISELGSGNFGCVQEFVHLESGFHMAIKRMKFHHHTDEDEDGDYVRRHVSKDLELLSKSRHNNIVQFYGYVLTDYYSELWLCMELMDCCFDRLITHLRQLNQTIPETIIGSVTVSIIEALVYLKQTHQVIHRDIKPSNILINRQGQIKLCDFGIYGCLVDSMTSSKTMGSVAYQAPERIQPPFDDNDGVGLYDSRVDVWSLGLTLLEMALGNHPYGNWTVAFEVITKIMNKKEVPTLPKSNKNYSAKFRDFITECLQHDYRQRPKYDQLKKMKFYKQQHQRFNIKNVHVWFNQVYYCETKISFL